MTFALACEGRLPEHDHVYVLAQARTDDGSTMDALVTLVVAPGTTHHGTLEALVLVPGAGGLPHHLEERGPIGSTLFASDMRGSAVVFDLGDAHKPRFLKRLPVEGRLRMPHGFAREGDSIVIVTYQGDQKRNASGAGLSAFTSRGVLLQESPSAQLIASSRPFRPYGASVLHKFDAIVVTGADMTNGDSTTSVQVWSVDPLVPKEQIELPAGLGEVYNRAPASSQIARDGAGVLVSTYRCGLYSIGGLHTSHASVRLLHVFTGRECGMGTRLGSLWIQTVSRVNGLEVVDVATSDERGGARRIPLGSAAYPHWIFADSVSNRVVITGSGTLDGRIILADVDTSTGMVVVDRTFGAHGVGAPGVDVRQFSLGAVNLRLGAPHGAVLVSRRKP